MSAGRAAEILVIHPGALGDVLQAVPALAALRRFGGGSRLTFAGQGRLGELLAGLGVVDEALAFDTLGLDALFAEGEAPPALASRLARFDRAVSWFGARAVPYPARLRAMVGDAILAAPVPDEARGGTVWEHLLATLEPWGLVGAPPPMPVAPPARWRRDARAALHALGLRRTESLVVVHPGAGGAWKRWPPDDLARVIATLGREAHVQTLVHRGPADAEVVARLVEALGEPLRCLEEPALPALAGVLAEAAGYLGADSGVSHLAAAVGAPAVILYPAATHERWRPWSPTAHAMRRGESSAEDVARALLDRLRAPMATGAPADTGR
jgi:heptosyltransferase III